MKSNSSHGLEETQGLVPAARYLSGTGHGPVHSLCPSRGPRTGGFSSGSAARLIPLCSDFTASEKTLLITLFQYANSLQINLQN